MATTVSITSSYAGEAAAGYISAMLLSGNTIANGLIEVKPNVKFKEVLRRLEIDSIVANATCDFTDTSTITTTERSISPKSLQVNLEVCKTSFRSDWDAISMGYSAFDNVPKTFADYVIGQISAKIAAKTEVDIWSGTDGAGEFDGFQTLLLADAAHTGAKKIVGEAITSANVVVELEKVLLQIPEQLLQDDSLYIYVANNVYRAYKLSLGGFGASGLGAAGVNAQGQNQDVNVTMFAGIKIVPVNGLPSNRMIATVKSNLFFACGLLSDQNEVKTLDMADLDGSQNFRFIARYTAAVNYAIVDEIVSYGLAL